MDKGDSVRTGMKCRLQRGQTVVLEHVQQGGFASVVQTQEEDLGILVE